MSNIKKILMEQEGFTSEEADAAIKEIREMITSGASHAEIEMALEDFGLEMDYVLDFL